MHFSPLIEEYIRIQTDVDKEIHQMVYCLCKSGLSMRYMALIVSGVNLVMLGRLVRY